MNSTATLIATVAALALVVGCSSAVESARDSNVPGARRTVDGPPDVSPKAQHCERDNACYILRSAPGHSLHELCCATCVEPIAVNLDVAADVARWRRGIDCGRVMCTPPADACSEEATIKGVACVDGLCQVVAVP